MKDPLNAQFDPLAWLSQPYSLPSNFLIDLFLISLAGLDQSNFLSYSIYDSPI